MGLCVSAQPFITLRGEGGRGRGGNVPPLSSNVVEHMSLYFAFLMVIGVTVARRKPTYRPCDPESLMIPIPWKRAYQMSTHEVYGEAWFGEKIRYCLSSS